MPGEYIPVFIFALLAAAFPAVSLFVFKFIRPDMQKIGARLEPYECGIPGGIRCPRPLLGTLLHHGNSICYL